jgi:tRNA threonylcarbamoyladenosine biosynthesis protein TsaB
VLNLALDTATPWGRFALAEGERLLGYLPVNVTGNYADALLPVIDRLLQESGRSLSEVGAVGITRGPGSFTGIRIGVATAKGLAYGLGARLVAVSTLAAMAAAVLAEQPERELAVPVLDARRGEVFAGVFGRAGNWVIPLAEPAAATPDTWWTRLRSELADLEAPIWCGSGVPLLLGQGPHLRAELRARGEPVPRHWIYAHPATARALALAMADRQLLPATHPFALTPLYLRLSDAEIKRGLDLTPGGPAADLPRGEPPPRAS